jgi:hypothetical protein
MERDLGKSRRKRIFSEIRNRYDRSGPKQARIGQVKGHLAGSQYPFFALNTLADEIKSGFDLSVPCLPKPLPLTPTLKLGRWNRNSVRKIWAVARHCVQVNRLFAIMHVQDGSIPSRTNST